MTEDDEDKRLRLVALQTANSILVARQRAEQELLQAKEALEAKTAELAHTLSMMRATLESTTDGILVTDESGVITGFNEKFVEMWKIPRDVMDSREHHRLREVMSQFFEDSQHFIARVDAIYTSALPETLDVLELANGRVVERFSRVQSVDGRPVGRVWSFRDITERRRTEEALVEANRRKDEFLAVVAHELRNPLSSVLMAARILQMKGPAEPALEKLRETIVRQTLQLSKLVDDLLDVGRITTGKLRLEKKRVELNTLLKQAVETSSPMIERRHHALRVDLSDPPIYVEVDAGRIVQVLGNLLNNACKYMNEGGRIELVAFEERGHAVIRVVDEGVGISEDMLSRIFQRFVQANSSSNDGLGIGLSVVKALVELHGGSVKAASKGIGKGSEFTLRLPLSYE